jgi:hypothetical protein
LVQYECQPLLYDSVSDLKCWLNIFTLECTSSLNLRQWIFRSINYKRHCMIAMFFNQSTCRKYIHEKVNKVIDIYQGTGLKESLFKC